MGARFLLIASATSLMIATCRPGLPARRWPARRRGPARTPGVPPPADRIAATTATFNAIEAKIAAGQSLRLRFPDPTAQSDIIDYGVNDLWKKGIDGAGRDRGLRGHQPRPGPRGVNGHATTRR